MVVMQIPLVLMALAIFIVAFTFSSGTLADHVDSFCRSSVDAQESSLHAKRTSIEYDSEYDPEYNECHETFANLATVMRNVAVAGSVVAFIVNGGGIPAAIKANKPGLGVYIAGTIIAIITLVVCVALPAVSSVLFGVLCAAAEPCYRCDDSMSVYSCSSADYKSASNCAVYSSDYDAFCVDLKGKIDAVTSIFVIEVVGTFVLSVLTCVIIGRVGKRVGQTTVVVMQTVPPLQPYSPGYYQQQQQHGYTAPHYAQSPSSYPGQPPPMQPLQPMQPMAYPGPYPPQPQGYASQPPAHYPPPVAYAAEPPAFYPAVTSPPPAAAAAADASAATAESPPPQSSEFESELDGSSQPLPAQQSEQQQAWAAPAAVSPPAPALEPEADAAAAAAAPDGAPAADIAMRVQTPQ